MRGEWRSNSSCWLNRSGTSAKASQGRLILSSQMARMIMCSRSSVMEATGISMVTWGTRARCWSGRPSWQRISPIPCSIDATLPGSEVWSGCWHPEIGPHRPHSSSGWHDSKNMSKRRSLKFFKRSALICFNNWNSDRVPRTCRSATEQSDSTAAPLSSWSSLSGIHITEGGGNSTSASSVLVGHV